MTSQHLLSLKKNIDDREHLIYSATVDFVISAVSGSRILRNRLPRNDVSLLSYSYAFFCSMKANTGSTLIYVSDRLSCRPKHDLTICKTSELASAFIEIKKLMLLLDASMNVQI